ncbi:anthranilate phosphoribosyltransferase [Candidatus Gracilibacteria bacterium]|nr:anthranilate phosphoribosyltransferase [Candidatus Gracilibacteria bacterium]
MKTLIIDNYDSFTYNLYQYVAELGGNPVVIRNDGITLEKIKSEGYSHIIISPGPGSPENQKDFGICAEVIKQCTDTPILGVCLGHQGMIYALGGRVVRAPEPVHGKRSTMKVDTDSVLFKGLPTEITGMRYHSLIGERESLPEEFSITAETTADHLVMGVQHKTRPLFGIQFHPESIGTPTGKTIIANFLSCSGSTSPEEQAELLFHKMVSGAMNDEKILQTLKTMAERGETVEEITGMARAMRSRSVKIPYDGEVMDVCGTGGSGLPRMNISTAAAFVLAVGGVVVAKHGNKAASGRCGSFDLLEALGVRVELDAEAVATTLKKLGIGFIYAPLFHPAMKSLAPIRKKLGIRTIFNLLGPLSNPLKPSYHLLGVSSLVAAQKIAAASRLLNYKRIMVCVGENGLDEITLVGKTTIFDLENGIERCYEFLPEEAGLHRVEAFEEIAGGDSETNKKIFLELLEGKSTESLQNFLALNCGFGFYIRGTTRTIKEGVQKAQEIITSGAALALFNSYKQLSNEI